MENIFNNLHGSKILITGGLGFVGSNIAHACVQYGAKVTIFDCLDPKSGGNMQNIEEIKNDVEIVLNDVRNFEPICEKILRKDFIFHCAAYTSHPQSMKDPVVDIDVNCKGTINVLEAVRRFNPDIKVIYIGTSTQIGKMLLGHIDELHPEFPLDIYSANKTVAEKYVLIYGKAYNIRTTVIRLSNTYGPRSNIVSSDFGFMNYFIGLGLKGKEIPVYGDGVQLRNINYVEDAVEAMLLAALNEKSNQEVYFAVSDEHLTIDDIAQTISTHIGGYVRYIEWPIERRIIEIGDMRINNKKIKAELDWLPKHDIAAGLKKTKAYYESCLEKYIR